MTRRDPTIIIRQMIDFASDGLEVSAGRARPDLDGDIRLRYALTYVLLGIGEAANRLPAEFHSRHPSVAWSNIIGMRHRLVHGYDSVDLDRVWLVVTAELRPLIA